MELFSATGKLKKLFFLQLEMFNVCTTADTAHIDTIFKFLPHTRQHGCTDILHWCDDEYKKTFPVAVNNSIKVGSLVFLLYMSVITENITKRPVLNARNSGDDDQNNYCSLVSETTHTNIILSLGEILLSLMFNEWHGKTNTTH
jgi:hypothetical protein